MPDPESEETLPQLLQQKKPTIVAPVWSDFSSTFAAKCHAANALVFVDERESTQANWLSHGVRTVTKRMTQKN